MEIGRDARPDPFEREQTGHARPVEPVSASRDDERGQREKPPALPHGPKNRELDGGRLRAEGAIASDGPHNEAIASRREAGVIDGALFGQRIPVLVSTFEPVLIPEFVSRTGVQAEELDLQLILIRFELESRNLALTQVRSHVAFPGDAQAANQDGRWRSSVDPALEQAVRGRCSRRTRACRGDPGSHSAARLQSARPPWCNAARDRWLDRGGPGRQAHRDTCGPIRLR